MISTFDIRKRAAHVQTKEQLLELINDIKKSEMGDDAYPITMRQMNYHCNPNRNERRYVSFAVPKKSGGVRTINAPNKGLKEIQILLNKLFAAIYTPSKYAMGFAKHRSVAHNAQMHTGKNYVFNIDLKDFFTSIQQARVWKRLQLPPFNFSQEVANMIAGLCCMKMEDNEHETNYALPQGAPTSPLLTNAICDTLDRRLAGLATRFGLNYSRYADDITFSSMHNVYGKQGEFINELTRIINQQGFTINESKTRLQKKNSKQEVTGLIVNEKINVARKFVRELRDLLYIWSRYGYTAATNKFIAKYKLEKGHVKKGEPILENVMKGKLLYLRMVKGEYDSAYLKLNNKFRSLVRKNSEHTIFFVSSGIKFIETMPISSFEEKTQASLTIECTEHNNKHAWFMRNGKKVNVYVSHSLTYINKETTAISLCEKDAHRFFLIHLPLHTTENPIHFDDVDENADAILAKLYESGFNLDILTCQ